MAQQGVHATRRGTTRAELHRWETEAQSGGLGGGSVAGDESETENRLGEVKQLGFSVKLVEVMKGYIGKRAERWVWFVMTPLSTLDNETGGKMDPTDCFSKPEGKEYRHRSRASLDGQRRLGGRNGHGILCRADSGSAG